MFLPGIGAVVRFRDGMSPREEARVGLAGPLWGAGAALVALAIAVGTESRLWAAIAHTGAWVNLFNLLPIVPLDGGRGFRGLARNQRLATLPVIAAAWWVTGDGLLVLVLLAAAYQAFQATAPPPDRGAYLEYAGLIAGLSLLAYVAASTAHLGA
jgi:Zn-dependent protease